MGSLSLRQLVGEATTGIVILSLVGLAVTEFLGARVSGFSTISDVARREVDGGDYRLFLAVLGGFLVGAGWWALHVLWPRL